MIDSCINVQYPYLMETLLPTQWIHQCAERLHERWHTVEPAQLEEVAMDLWRDEGLRKMHPKDAASSWLVPVSSKEDSTP